MDVPYLAILLQLIGLRGPIGSFADIHPIPLPQNSMAGRAVRALAAFLAVVAVLSLAVWVTVWFAIALF